MAVLRRSNLHARVIIEGVTDCINTTLVRLVESCDEIHVTVCTGLVARHGTEHE